MPTNWPEDPSVRGRPEHSSDRDRNPRNRMESGGGGGGGDQSGCALWTLMAVGALAASVAVVLS